jgi:hypothetical protein
MQLSLIAFSQETSESKRISFSIEGINHSNEGDIKIIQTINYYRIHQTDYDGTTSDYRIVSIDNTFTDGIILYTTNLLGQKVDATYKGIVIDVHSNGKTVKRISVNHQFIRIESVI